MILPDQLQGARLALVQKRPYLASIIWSLIPVARDSASGLQTMAVDRYGRWYINIDEVIKWPIGKIALCIIHECNHLLRHHHDRMVTYQEWMTPQGISLSNMGGDLEINDDLAEEASDFKVPVPDDWLYPKQFNFPTKLFAEEYCEKLLKQAQRDGRCFSMPMPNGGGKNNPNQGQGKGKDGQKGGGVGNGTCGSCSGSAPASWEEGPPAGTPGVNSTSPVPGLSPSEIDVIRRQVAQAVKDHVTSRGNVPGGWKRWAEAELEPPKIPWTKELAAIIRRTQADLAGLVDYSWKRLSKRSSDEILLPGLRKPKLEAVGVIDTSGSMSDDDLTRSLREFAGVLKVVGLAGMNFISVDAAAQASKKVFKVEQIQLVGGGGTDMRVGIAAALKTKPKPDFVVVFTDGYTPWPDSPPSDGTKVIAVLVEKGPEPPKWIRSLYVD